MKIVLTLISLLYFFPIKAQKVEIYFDLGANYFWLKLDNPELRFGPNGKTTNTYEIEAALNGYQGAYGINFKVRKKLFVGIGLHLKHTRLKGKDPNGVRFTFNYLGLCPRIEYRFMKSLSYSTGFSLDQLIHKKGLNLGILDIRDSHLKIQNASWLNQLSLRFRKNIGIYTRFDLGLSSLVDLDLRLDPITFEVLETIPIKVKSRLIVVGFYYILD